MTVNFKTLLQDAKKAEKFLKPLMEVAGAVEEIVKLQESVDEKKAEELRLARLVFMAQEELKKLKVQVKAAEDLLRTNREMAEDIMATAEEEAARIRATITDQAENVFRAAKSEAKQVMDAAREVAANHRKTADAAVNAAADALDKKQKFEDQLSKLKARF